MIVNAEAKDGYRNIFISAAELNTLDELFKNPPTIPKMYKEANQANKGIVCFLFITCAASILTFGLLVIVKSIKRSKKIPESPKIVSCIAPNFTSKEVLCIPVERDFLLSKFKNLIVND